MTPTLVTITISLGLAGLLKNSISPSIHVCVCISKQSPIIPTVSGLKQVKDKRTVYSYFFFGLFSSFVESISPSSIQLHNIPNDKCREPDGIPQEKSWSFLFWVQMSFSLFSSSFGVVLNAPITTRTILTLVFHIPFISLTRSWYFLTFKNLLTVHSNIIWCCKVYPFTLFLLSSMIICILLTSLEWSTFMEKSHKIPY